MDLQKQSGYWQGSAEEDWDAALDLANSGRFRHSLFFAHLALEKLLKAHVCRKTSALAPKIHSLLRLAKESGLQFSAEHLEFLAKTRRDGRSGENLGMVEESVVNSVREYLRAVNRAGIHARQAVLFGSHARGEARPDSDIDIVVIAPEFDGPPDESRLDLLWRLRVSTDARIEPIACGEHQWLADDARVVLEIARTEGHAITLETAA